MTHDNSYRPPLDLEHMQRQISEVLRYCNEKHKRETDPTEEPKDLYDGQE